MKNIKILSSLVISTLFFYSCNKTELVNTPVLLTNESEVSTVTYNKSSKIPNQYIIVLNEDVISTDRSNLKFDNGDKLVKAVAHKIFLDNKISDKPILQSYAHALTGFVVNCTGEELESIRRDRRIKYIEQDQIISLAKPDKPGKPGGGGDGGGEDPVQVIPWGISTVGGAQDGTSTGKKAWIIDSGIDLNHPDLNVDVASSRSFLGGKQSTNPDDQNGHGTHVSGTIGALNNSFGVVGVAAGVDLVAVRVLDRRGSGAISGVIAGVNYVKSNALAGDVANMSLGGGISTTLDNAVLSAASSGIKFVIAAGNDSRDANNNSPARVNGPNIYTVSAMDINQNWAYFSNYGNPPIDFCAPGVNINSTYKNGGYTSLNGTSMAAPHVAGILIMGAINSTSTVNGDPDSSPDAIAHL